MTEQKRPNTQAPPQMPDIRGGRGGGPMGARVNKEKPKNTLKTLKRLFKYVGKSKLLIFALLGIMLVVTVSDLAGPALQGAAINTISVVDGKVSVDFESMCVFLGVMAVLFVISASMSFLQGPKATTRPNPTSRATRTSGTAIGTTRSSGAIAYTM